MEMAKTVLISALLNQGMKKISRKSRSFVDTGF